MLKIALLTLLWAPRQDAEKDFAPLFNGKDFTGWTFMSGTKKEDPAQAFSVKDGVLVCSRKLFGSLQTEKSYRNFTLRYDWAFKRPENLKDDAGYTGNSGCLVFVADPARHGTYFGCWPKSVEIQGMHRDHGQILPIPRELKVKCGEDAGARKKVLKPVGEWSSTEIVVKEGSGTVHLNGAKVAWFSECELTEGPIAFQSEGAEIQYRNIRIKEEKMEARGGTELSGALEAGPEDAVCLKVDGVCYDLHGDLKGFKAGDAVRVTGSVARDFACTHMCGTIFKVDSIAKKEK